MILKINNLCLLLYLFNVISQSNCLVEFHKTNISDNVLLLKILQSIDAASSDTHLFDVTLKLLQSVCACMHKTLHKEHKIFSDEANLLHLEENSEQENDIKLYKQIYNNTCIHLRHELVNKFRRQELENKNDDTSQEINDGGTKYQDHLIDENIKAVIKRTIFASLIRKQNNRIYKIEKHNLFKNKLLIGRNHEIRVIIIITLYPFLNKTLDIIKQEEITEEEINKILLKDSPIDIDIINTVNRPENKKNFKAVIAKKCDLYSIYLFILQSLKRNQIKTFRFLRRKGTIKIYIDASVNQNVKDFSNSCCENNTLLTECRKHIFDEHDIWEKSVQNKTGLNKLEAYKDIVSKIKLLVDQYSNNKNNNQRLIRSSKLLLVTNPITYYGYTKENITQKLLVTTPLTYIRITPSNNNLQSSNRGALITPPKTITAPPEGYILSNKSSSLQDTSKINNRNTTRNEASSIKITTLLSGVALDHLFTNDDMAPHQIYRNLLNKKYINLITGNELVIKRRIVPTDGKTEQTSPMNLVFYSKLPQQYIKSITKTLNDPLTTITIFEQVKIPKSNVISSPQYIADTNYLKILIPPVKENGTSTKPFNNIAEKSNTKDKSGSSLMIETGSHSNVHSLFTNSPTSVLNYTKNNINLFTSSLQYDYAKSSTEAMKTNTLLKDNSTSLESLQIVMQPDNLNKMKYLQEKRNESMIKENLNQNKGEATSVENTFTFDRNNKTYISNTNKKIADITRTESKTDKHVHVTLIEKVEEHVISEQNNNYEQTSPLEFIIYPRKQPSIQNEGKIPTTVSISDKSNDTLKQNNVNFIKLITLQETSPFLGVRHLESNWSPLTMHENNTIYRRTTLPQLKSILNEKQNTIQKDLNNQPSYKINLLNDYDNFINDSISETFLTSNNTSKFEMFNGKNYTVNDVKQISDLFTHLSNNNEASLERYTVNKNNDIYSNDLENYVWSSQSPNKFDANWINDTQLNLIPDLTTLLGSTPNKNIITPDSNDENEVGHEKFTLHYSIPRSVNKYIISKSEKRQHFETSAPSTSEMKYFNKYYEKRLQRPPLFKDKINRGGKKIKLNGVMLPENKNPTKQGNVLGSQNFEVTKSNKKIAEAETYSKGYKSIDNGNSILPSLIITKLRPQSASKIKNMHHLSILNAENSPKLKENDTFSWMNEIMLEKSSTGDSENKNSKVLDPDPYESEDIWKAFTYFSRKNTSKALYKDITVKHNFLKDTPKIYKTKIPLYTTNIFSIKTSQNKQNTNNENKEADDNNKTLLLNKGNYRNKSNINNTTIPTTTTGVIIKLISNNDIVVTENTNTKPQILPKKNLYSNISAKSNEMFTTNKDIYAPNIAKTKSFNPITLSILYMPHAKHATQFSKFNSSKSTITMATENISYKENDQKIKQVTSTKKERKNKDSISLPTLPYKSGWTQSLNKNNIISSTENTNILTYFDATKELMFQNEKLSPEENHVVPKPLPVISSKSKVILNNIYDNKQLNKLPEHGSKKSSFTEEKEVSQSVYMTSLLRPLKENIQNFTKDKPYLTKSFKKFSKRSTKTLLKDNIFNTSTINKQIKIAFDETNSTNNFNLIKRQPKTNTLETFTSRYTNAYKRNKNNSGVNLKRTHSEPKIRILDHTVRTNNKTTILHKDLTLVHHTRPHTSDFNYTGTIENVSTTKTVHNELTANKLKSEDILLPKVHDGLQNTNLKQYKQKETLDAPISNKKNLSLFFSTNYRPPIKESIQRIIVSKSITSTETNKNVKSLSKTMKVTTPFHLLLENTQLNQKKNGLLYSESYALNNNLKSDDLNMYISTPAFAAHVIQNITSLIPETYLNKDLKSIKITPKMYIKSSGNQNNKSDALIVKKNKPYNIHISRVTTIPTTETQNVQSMLPVLLRIDSITTFTNFSNYTQSGYPNIKIIEMPKNYSVPKSATLYYKTNITDKELKLHSYNQNMSNVKINVSSSIVTGNEVPKQELQKVLKEKRQYQDKKTSLHRYIDYALQVTQSTTKPYSAKDLNVHRRFHLKDNLSSTEYPFLKYRVTKLPGTDVRHNNKSGRVFSETKTKDINLIDNTVFLHITNDKNKNYDAVTLSVQRKEVSDITDNYLNHSILKPTSKKDVNSKNNISENMKKKFPWDKYKTNWNVSTNKTFGNNSAELVSRNKKKDKKVDLFKSKSTSTNTNASIRKLEVNNDIKYTTLEMSDLSLTSTVSSFVPHIRKSPETVLHYNNKPGEVFSVAKSKDKNVIDNIVIPNLTNGKRENNDVVTVPIQRKDASEIKDNFSNLTRSAILNSTSKKYINGKSLISENMKKRFSMEKKDTNRDVTIKKPFGNSREKLLSSEKKKDKRVDFSKFKSTATITDASLVKLEVNDIKSTASEMSQLLLNSIISSFIPHTPITKLPETDLRYNHKLSDFFSETTNKDKNIINNTVLPNFTNDKNKNYVVATLPVQPKEASDIQDNHLNHSTIPMSTSKKEINSKNIIIEHMKTRFPSDKYRTNLDISINKPFGNNHPRLLSSNNKKDIRIDFLTSKSTSALTASLLKKFVTNNDLKYTTSRISHLSLNSKKSSYVSYVTKMSERDLRDNNKPVQDFSEMKKKDKYLMPVQRKDASDIEDSYFNQSAMLKSTSKKENSKSIISENMSNKFSSDKTNWDDNINKPFGSKGLQLLSSNKNKDKTIDFVKPKSISTTRDSLKKEISLKKLEVSKDIKYTTSETSHLSLNSTISIVVPNSNSYTARYFPLAPQTAIENNINESVPFDRMTKMVDQKYYNSFPPETEIITQFSMSKINTTLTPNIEHKGHTTRSENTTNITRSLYQKNNETEHLHRTNVVLDPTDASFLSKDTKTSTVTLDVRKLQEQNLDKKIFSSNKRYKKILHSKSPVTNEAVFYTNKNIRDLRNDSSASKNIKIQINNNFKIKTLTYQKVYIKNDYKLRTTLRRYKKSKTIKYNTYQPTHRNLDITQSLVKRNFNEREFKSTFNKRDKQTNQPKYSSLSTRISNFTAKFILGTQSKLSKKIVATNRSNEHQPKLKDSNKKLGNVNENSLLYPFKKTNLYPVKKLPSNMQRKILRKIHFPNKDREIIAINTKDFFQRRATRNNNYFKTQYKPYSKNQIEKPVTPKPKQYIFSPMFDQIDDYDLKKYFRPKPLLIGNNDFYRVDLQTHHHSNALSLRQKVNYIRDALPPPVGNTPVSHVIERPVYLPPNTKPKFLRDRIDSIRNYLNMADFSKRPEFPIKHYVEATTNFAEVPYEDPLYYFRKSGWYDSDNSEDFITTTVVPKRTRRKKKTIFFLSPTVPYLYF